jgi:site-specific recombinase XerD
LDTQANRQVINIDTSRGLAAPVSQDTLDQIQREIERDPRLQSAHTRRAYLIDLRAFEVWRDGRPMTKGLVETYAVHLRGHDRSPNTINRALASVRWWARRLADLVFEEPLPKAKRDEIVLQASRVATIHDVKGERDQRGRHLGHDELQALLRVCRADTSPAGARDAALFALAWSTGMRRSEMAALRIIDIKKKDEYWTLQVHGKGNKVRTAYLSGAARWLDNWLARRGHDTGPVFCPISRKGKVLRSRGLSDSALAKMLERRSLEAALAERPRWHDFRRTFAGNLLDQGVDLATVQRLLGHTSPTTTSNYDRRGEETRRRAVDKLNVPYWDESQS